VPPAEHIALTDAKNTVSYKAYDHPVVVAAIGGNDRVTGSRFDDALDGGTCKDRLCGGAGDDTFVFDVRPGWANCDRILDFCSTDDLFQLDSSVFAGVAAGVLDPEAFVKGRAALDEDDRIIYDKSSGRLLFDSDGSGDAVAVTFATLNHGASVVADDFHLS
jgi:Ca2+-binding RTX toxin-like protein